MKKIITLYVILISLLTIPHAATSTRMDQPLQKIYVKGNDRFILDALTVYHPNKRQCDSTPLVTASNSKINEEDLRNQNLRWMALSRDLLKRWKGEFHYGDTVMVTSGDPQIDGLWVIKDTMNKRFRNRGDLLFDSQVRKLGKWNKVEISRVSWVTV